MPKVGTINALSEALRGEVDKRLRESGHGNFVALCQWLSESHGVITSKSALWNYSQKLKAKDRAASLVTKDLRGSLKDRQALDLLVELGTIRIRESRIIKRLEQIGFID